jgi:hypothetical protein
LDWFLSVLQFSHLYNGHTSLLCREQYWCLNSGPCAC